MSLSVSAGLVGSGQVPSILCYAFWLTFRLNRCVIEWNTTAFMYSKEKQTHVHHMHAFICLRWTVIHLLKQQVIQVSTFFCYLLCYVTHNGCQKIGKRCWPDAIDLNSMTRMQVYRF